MEKSTYLLYGTEKDQKSQFSVLMGVGDAITTLSDVAKSYGVEFSEEVINRLQRELDEHIQKMKKG